MFFNERLRSVNKSKRILEVGPGGTPHESSTEFLDIDPSTFKNDREALLQRGSAPALKTDKPITYYDGNKFPFKNKSFDYIISSHVLEHVEDVELFVSELMRVGNSGYIEYPTILYDYLYNIPVHLNFLHFVEHENTIYYLKKSDTHLSEFQTIHDFLLKTLDKGHSTLVDSFKDTMFEGFEWDSSKPIKVKKAVSIEQIMPTFEKVTIFETPVNNIVETQLVHINGVDSTSSKKLFFVLVRRVGSKLRRALKRRSTTE